jgi:hypothetical protein
MFMALAVLLVAGPAWGQATSTTPSTSSSTSATTTTTSLLPGQTQGLLPLQNLPPAPTCFICDCNDQDFDCRTSCQSPSSTFVATQQCLAACLDQQASCLANAQTQQSLIDAQRAQLLQQTGTSTSTTP